MEQTTSVIPSTNNVVNIKHKNFTAKASYYQLPFFKSMFIESRDYVKFIKAVEKLIRTSDEYKAYISYIKGDLGMNHCMIMSNIDDEKADIEMHHGPILTLFDYCDIVTSSLLASGQKVNTFMIADIVIKEHFENNVQVVMLSKTAHQLAHTGKLFIHPGQAWGNLNKFLEKYINGVSQEQIEIINEYIEQASKFNSTDGNYLKTNSVTSWDKQKKSMQELKNIFGDYENELEDELFE